MISSVDPARTQDASQAREVELRQVAGQFESLFMNMLMKSMRATVKKSGLFDGGRGEDIFTGILDTTVTEAAAKRGKGLGIADMIVKKYLRQASPEAEGTDGRVA